MRPSPLKSFVSACDVDIVVQQKRRKVADQSMTAKSKELSTAYRVANGLPLVGHKGARTIQRIFGSRFRVSPEAHRKRKRFA